MIKILNNIIFKPVNNNYNSYYNSIYELCQSIKDNQILLVKFTYFVNKGLDQYYDCEKYPKVYKSRRDCLKLVKDVIDNPTLLNCDKHKEKLKRAADAADAAANAYYATATYAADAAVYAADAAATYAAYVTNAVTSVNYAAYAAYAAANTANDRLQKIKEFYYNLCCLIIEEYELCEVKTFKLLFL